MSEIWFPWILSRGFFSRDHLLRRIDEKIDFEFVREMTAPLYCQENGRPSIDPVLFVRICLITYLCGRRQSTPALAGGE